MHACMYVSVCVCVCVFLFVSSQRRLLTEQLKCSGSRVLQQGIWLLQNTHWPSKCSFILHSALICIFWFLTGLLSVPVPWNHFPRWKWFAHKFHDLMPDYITALCVCVCVCVLGLNGRPAEPVWLGTLCIGGSVMSFISTTGRAVFGWQQERM